MDINFNIDNKTFNYRVAAIIKNENKILVTFLKNKRYSFIGGRVNFGETSIDGLIREVEEETGYKTIYKKTIGVFENFFVSEFTGSYFHEILIIHELEFSDKEVYEKEIIPNIEDKEDVYVWKEISELKNDNFEPKIVLDNLKNKEIVHLIVNK